MSHCLLRKIIYYRPAIMFWLFRPTHWTYPFFTALPIDYVSERIKIDYLSLRAHFVTHSFAITLKCSFEYLVQNIVLI